MARHYTINELRQKALSGDVSYDVNRLYRVRQGERQIPEVLAILALGHAIESKKWLESTTPEQMQYGTATKDERIAAAIKHAELAGGTVTDVAEVFGLEAQLDGYIPPEQ